ncbi:MAG: gas vesicle protein [Chlamydiota bacterium]
MRPEGLKNESLADVVERILDKGLVINADISISLVGTELLGIKIRAALASFETAARYGLMFPSDTNLKLPIWEKAKVIEEKESCPQCEKTSSQHDLLTKGCPWCGYKPQCLQET